MIGFRAVSAGHLPTPTDEDFHVDDDLSTPLIHAVYCTYAIKTRWLPLVFAYLPITFTGNRGRIPVYVSYVVYDLYIFNIYSWIIILQNSSIWNVGNQKGFNKTHSFSQFLWNTMLYQKKLYSSLIHNLPVLNKN